MTEGAIARDFATTAVLPPVPGLRFRHFAGPSDYPGMNDAANDSRVADEDAFITPLEGFANFYDHLVNSDRDRDIVVVEIDGAIVGYARTEWRVQNGDERVHELICFLRRAWRRRGIGRALLATIEARAAEVGAGLEPAEKSLFQVFGHVGDGGLPALMSEAGYEPVRHGFQMVRPTLDDQPDVHLLEGLEIREVQDEHFCQIWDASDEAFRDHWGYSLPTEADYELFLNDPLSRDRSLWRIAWDGDEVAGQVRGYINEDENRLHNRRRGWVENISVGRPWRHRGLARALINATFKVLRDRGMTEGALGVDAQNPTGALRVYESVGFRPVSQSTTYRKPMPPA